MNFERLCDLPCATDEGLGEAALTRWRVETICDEKGVLGELGSPCDDGRHECGMQGLVCTRVGRIVGVDGRILRNVHV